MTWLAKTKPPKGSVFGDRLFVSSGSPLSLHSRICRTFESVSQRNFKTLGHFAESLFDVQYVLCQLSDAAMPSFEQANNSRGGFEESLDFPMLAGLTLQ